MKSITQILQHFEKRQTNRSTFEAMWRDIFNYYLPRRAGMYEESQGIEKTKYIYDSTPGVALLRLAAVLNSMLTNRQLNWFKLETSDDDINELPETKEWLEHDENQLRNSLDNSNFYSQAHEAYIDLGGPGQFVMYIEPYAGPDRDFYFSTRHIKECFLSEGDQGLNNLIDLSRSMTARQIIDRWNKAKITGAIPEEVQKDFEKEPEKRHDILQSVFPNDDYKEGSLNPREFAYQVAWIHIEKKQEIDRGGYHEFPFAICQWSKATGEDYGRGPGWDALADTKILYAMRKTTIRVAEKIADPPVQLPSKGYINQVELSPGGLNFYDQTTGQGRIELIEFGRNFPISLEMIQDQRNQILNHFYTSQLQLIDVREMTAEEARIRTSENARIIGPTFGRLNDDFLDPLIGRCLGILRRSGKLTKIPAVVTEAARKKGITLRVRFVSPLAKAQAADEIQGIQRTIGTAIEWSLEGQNPTVLDNINFDEALRKIADIDGTPLEILNDKDQVNNIRKLREDNLKQEREITQLTEAARGIKDAAAAGREIKEVAGTS